MGNFPQVPQKEPKWPLIVYLPRLRTRPHGVHKQSHHGLWLVITTLFGPQMTTVHGVSIATRRWISGLKMNRITVSRYLEKVGIYMRADRMFVLRLSLGNWRETRKSSSQSNCFICHRGRQLLVLTVSTDLGKQSIFRTTANEYHISSSNHREKIILECFHPFDSDYGNTFS